MNYNDKSLAMFRKVVDRREFDRENGTVSAELLCPPDFLPFAGHFPGQPVLPAVIQLAFVRMLSADLLRAELDIVEIGRVKFKEMIKPDERIHVHVVLERQDQHWHAVFKLKKMEATVSAGSVLYKARC